MQTHNQQTQNKVAQTKPTIPFSHSEQVQVILNKLKSGQMKFVC